MFNIKRYSLLILTAILIMLIIPMSFAAEVSDDNNATLQIDDADEIGMDNVGEALSVDDSDKLSEGYDFEIVPNETEINYVLGTSHGVSITKHYKDSQMQPMTLIYAYVNGGNDPITIKTPGGYNVYVYSDTNVSVVDIGSFSQYLHEGTNTVVFHPENSVLSNYNYVNNNFVPITIIASEPTDPPTFYYVDSNASFDGYGAEGSVYTTISAAINAANSNFGVDGGSIIIKNGVYNESSTISISKNMLITADEGADVTITSTGSGSFFSQTTNADVTLSDLTFRDMQITSGAVYYQNGNAVDGSTLIVQNCNFINNTAPTLVRLVKTKATFKYGNFIDNTLTDTGNGRGGLIDYYDTGTSQYQLNKYVFDVSYCNIVGNEFANEYVFMSPSYQTLVANNNYWGSNYELKPTKIYNKESNSDYLTLTNWVVIDTTIPDMAAVGESTPITLEFKHNDGSALTDNMPDLDVELSATGSFSPSNVTISENTAQSNYMAQKTGVDNITVKSSSTTLLSKSVICNASDSVYISTPTVNGQSSIEYVINEHVDVLITVTCSKLDNFQYYDKLYAWIGDNYKEINVMANEASATIDLKDLSDKFRFDEGQTYTIYFHPNSADLTDAHISEDNCVFNPLTVRTVGTYTPEPTVTYTSTPTVGGETTVDYTIGEDAIVTVNVVYNESYASNAGFSGKKMRMFINGDTTGVVLSNVDANAFSFTVNLKDYISEEGNYNIIFSPGDSVLSWVFWGVDNYVVELNNLTVNAVNATVHGEDDYLYTITPTPSSVADYSGESKIITVNANYTSTDYIQGQLSVREMYIYINDNQIESLSGIKANEISFTFNLADYSNYLVKNAVNNISIHPNVLGLDTAFHNDDHSLYLINNLTVTVKDDLPEYTYISTPSPSKVNYTKNDSCVVSVSISGNSASNFSGGTMYIYIDSISVELAGIDSDATQFNVDLADYDEYFTAGRTSYVRFHPEDSMFGKEGTPTLDQAEFNILIVDVKEKDPSPTYVSTVVPNKTTYVFGESLNVTVNVEYDDYFNDALSYLGMYVYINGEDISNRVEIEGIKANETTFLFDLKTINDKLVLGENTLSFHPHPNGLEGIFVGPYVFNNLTVTAKTTNYVYESIPNETAVDYIFGEDKLITVTVYGDLSGYGGTGLNTIPVCAWINGEDPQINRYLINGVKATDSSFEFNLADISNKLRQGENTVTFHIDPSFIEQETMSNNYKFNTLTVNADFAQITGPLYNTTISPNQISEYANGTSQIITVTASYNETKASSFGYRPMYMYINGTEIQIANVYANSTEFSFDLADYAQYLVEGQNNISVHPQMEALKGIFQTNNEDLFEIDNLTVNMFVIEKVTPEINVGAEGITYGEKLIVTVETSSDISEVNVTVGDETEVASLTNGIGSVEFDGLNAGSYTVTASYAGDNKYNEAVSNITATVNKADVNIAVVAGDVNYGELVIVEITGSVAGTYTVTVNGVTKNVAVTVGKASSVNFGALNAATYTIAANYIGTANYNAAVNDTESVVVSKADVNIAVVAGDVNYGEDVVVEITGSVAGTYTVTVNGVTKNVAVTTGKASSVNFGVLDANEEGYSITANYAGTTNYNSAVNNTETVIVHKLNPNLVVGDSLSISVDESVSIGAVADSDISYAVVSGSDVISVDASGVVTGLKGGRAIVAVSVDESDKYYAAEKNVTVTVSKLDANLVVGDSLSISVDESVSIGAAADSDISYAVVSGSDVISVDASGVVTGLKGGVATVTVSVDESDKYYADSKNVTVTVSKLNPTLVTKTLRINVDESNPIDVTTNSDSPISYVVVYGNAVISVDANGVVTGLKGGRAIVTVGVAESDKYYATEKNVTVIVSKLNPNLMAPETLIVAVNNSRSIDATSDSDNPIRYTVVSGSDLISIDDAGVITGLEEGEAIITVSVAESGKYLADSKNVVVTVNGTVKRVVPTINVTANPVSYGNDIIIDVQLPYDVTRRANITVDGNSVLVSLTHGYGRAAFSGFAIGTYNVVVSYNGDSYYLKSSVSTTVKVTKRVTDINVTANPISYGEDAVIEVQLPSEVSYRAVVEIGNVSKPVTLKNGVGSVKFSGLAAGTHDVVVSYKGDAYYLKSSVNATVKVNRATPEIIVTADPIQQGEDLIVNVQLPSDVTRRVSINIGDVTKTVSLKDGVGSAKFSNLARGTYDIIVSYGGDSNYLKASVNAVGKVNRGAPEIIVSADDIKQGEDLIVNVQLPSDVTRRATVKIGDETKNVILKEGIGSAKFSGLNVGTYTITVSYGGDTNYLKASVNTTVKVNRGPAAINVTANPISYGEDVVINVQLPSDVTRRVTITVGNVSKLVSVKNGVGSLKVSGLDVGTYDVTVSYGGDTNYLKSSVNTTVKVNKATPEIQVTANSITAGEVAIVEVTLPSDVAKRPLVEIEGVKKYVTVKNGVGTVKFTELSAGTHEINVSYVGDANYKKASTTASIIVEK